MYNAEIQVETEEQLDTLKEFARENGLELEIYTSHYEQCIREEVNYRIETFREDIGKSLDADSYERLVETVTNEVYNNAWLSENMTEIIDETLSEQYQTLYNDTKHFS